MREREETIFLVSLILFYPIPKDTTSSALLCLQCFGSFHVILLSRRQHYTELTYVFPEPLIHSPKSIRYSLCPRKSILELHSMQIPLFLFFFFPYNPQLSISVTFLCRFPCHSLSFSFFFFFHAHPHFLKSSPLILKSTALSPTPTQGQNVNRYKWSGIPPQHVPTSFPPPLSPWCRLSN